MINWLDSNHALTLRTEVKKFKWMKINKTLQGCSNDFESEEDQSPKTILGTILSWKSGGAILLLLQYGQKSEGPDDLLVDYNPALGLYAHSKPVIQGLKNKWTHECCNRSYREDGNRGR